MTAINLGPIHMIVADERPIIDQLNEWWDTLDHQPEYVTILLTKDDSSRLDSEFLKRSYIPRIQELTNDNKRFQIITTI